MMRRFGEYLIAVSLSLTLLSCSSFSSGSMQMEIGKQFFENGDYKNAFHRLLPVAVQGKAEAQYAVGYMYYYGYGAPIDAESGIFWINKAAEQHYALAELALKKIHDQAVDKAVEEQRAKERDQRLQLMQTIPAKKVSLQTVPEKTIYMPSEKPVVPATTSHHFALQLYGSYHLPAVKQVQTQLRLKKTGHVYQTTHNGKNWYVLTFGNFFSAHEAAATKKNLPHELKSLTPWVRKVDDLVLA